MFTLLRAWFLFALGMYTGIGTAVVLAGPAVFRNVASRTEAGTAFATILRATTTVDVGLAVVVAVTGVLWLRRAVPGWRRTAAAAAVALLLAGIGLYKFGIMPAMQEHRRHITSFDSAEVDEHRAAFDQLHVQYVRVYGANLVVCVGAFLLACGLPAARPSE